ncbi:MAG: DNA polymerase III subunit chi [Neisseriaceae bacterium]|nr:DNA polymerase III subunit chi [Neisseriaceae bacterium]
MPLVTFYTHITDIHRFVCRLLQTAYDKQTPVAVRCASVAQAQTIDNALWTFDHNSFLAHEFWAENQTSTAPIVLITPNEHAVQCPISTVLNLSPTPCLEPNIQRVLEIISADEHALSQARNHFRLYRDAGFQLEHHKIQAA